MKLFNITQSGHGFHSALCQVASLGLSFILLIGSVHGQQENEGTETIQRENATFSMISNEGGNTMIFAGSSIDGGPMTISNMPLTIMGDPNGLGLGSLAGPSDPFALLNDEDIQKEIELAGSQLEKIQLSQEEFSKRIQEQMGDLQNGRFEPGRMQGLGKLIKEMQEDQRAKMESMLLPHQIERLQQISTQLHLNRAGTAEALANEKMMEMLEISTEQVERLRKRSKEIEQQLKEKVEQLKAEAQAELLKELTPNQRQKLEKLTGPKYNLPERDLRSQFKQQLQGKRQPTDAGHRN